MQLQGQDYETSHEVSAWQQLSDLLQTRESSSGSSLAICRTQSKFQYYVRICRTQVGEIGSQIQEPTEVPCPIWQNVNGEWKHVQTTVPVIDVHELLDYLHSSLDLRCPADETKRYWTHLRQQGMAHAVHFPGTDAHIPFSLYGDATLLKPKVSRHSMFLLACMQDDLMIHHEMATLRPILQHIVWCCNLAFDGKYPSVNMRGGALSPNKTSMSGRMLPAQFACAELRGDWKWHERVLRLCNTPVSTSCCFLCRAKAKDNSALRYYDVSEGAAWRQSAYNTNAFIVEAVRPGPLSTQL